MHIERKYNSKGESFEQLLKLHIKDNIEEFIESRFQQITQKRGNKQHE